MLHHNNDDKNGEGDERDERKEEELEEADTTHIQCDAPGCGRWYSGGDNDDDDDYDDDNDGNGPLPLPPGELAFLYEVWHCPLCAPYLGPGTLHRRRQLRRPASGYGLRKRRKIDFVRLNDPGMTPPLAIQSFVTSEDEEDEYEDDDGGGRQRQRQRRRPRIDELVGLGGGGATDGDDARENDFGRLLRRKVEGGAFFCRWRWMRTTPMSFAREG